MDYFAGGAEGFARCYPTRRVVVRMSRYHCALCRHLDITHHCPETCSQGRHSQIGPYYESLPEMTLLSFAAIQSLPEISELVIAHCKGIEWGYLRVITNKISRYCSSNGNLSNVLFNFDLKDFIKISKVHIS